MIPLPFSLDAKTIAIAGAIALVAIFAYFVVGTIKENGRLSSELNQAVQANIDNQNEINELRKLREEDTKRLKARDNYRKQQETAIGKLRRRLRNATATEITKTEQECMQSDIPLPVLDILQFSTENSN